MRDFIEWWYHSNISDCVEFPNDVRESLDFLLAKLSLRVSSIDPKAFFAKHVVSSLSDLLRIWRLTERDLKRTNSAYCRVEMKTQVVMITAAIKENFKLHPAVRGSQAEHCKLLATNLVKVLLMQRDYSSLVIRSLAREVFSRKVR